MRPELRAAILLAGLLAAGSSGSAAEDMESSCISCHLEEEDEDLVAPVVEWRESVHAEAGVGCDSCHGGDPQQMDADLAMDEEDAGYLGAPGRKEVIEFCGTCHEEIAEGFRQSVMGKKSVEGERVATCVTCHMTDGHAIGKPDVRAILTEKRCGECHEGSRAIKLRDSLLHLNALIRRADESVAPIRGQIDTSRLDNDLREAREKSIVVAHTYDLARILEVSEGAELRLGRLKDEAAQLEHEVGRRRRTGAAVVGFFALACLATLRLSANLRRRSSSDDMD